MWGDSPSKPIATKFCRSVELADVINRAKFHLDQSGVLLVERVKIWRLPLNRKPSLPLLALPR